MDSSSITTLPDEIILQILKRLIDLKTLCFCYLVSKRFSSILLQVDAISFTAPLIHPPIPDKNTDGDVAPSMPLPPIISLIRDDEYFLSVSTFLSKFKVVKSLVIELPSSTEIGIDNRCLFKWKVKFGNKIEWFMFLWPNSVPDKDGFYRNGNEDDEEDIGLANDLFRQKCQISSQCLEDAVARHKTSLFLIKNLPTLEKVSITDSGRRGEVSLSGEKLSEVKELLAENVMNRVDVLARVRQCYIPVLKLPVSGYVMKGVFAIVMEMKDLQVGNDVLMNSESGFEDKEEAAYTEAVKEILEKHEGLMHTIYLV